MSSKTGLLRWPAAGSGGVVPSLQVMGWGGVPGQAQKTNGAPVSFAPEWYFTVAEWPFHPRPVFPTVDCQECGDDQLLLLPLAVTN